MTDNTLDKILHRLARYYEAVGRSKTPPNKTDFAKAKKEIESLIAGREKKMLEFVIPKKKICEFFANHIESPESGWCKSCQISENYNQAIDEISQRAKEWSKKNG